MHRKGVNILKNTLKTFQIICRPDLTSQDLAKKIENLLCPFLEKTSDSSDGDFAIAIGGDGTF